MNIPLMWHPKLNVYRYQDQGLLLVSETTSLWLAKQTYAFIDYVNGTRTAAQINQLLSQQTTHPLYSGELYFDQLNQLIEQGLLLRYDPVNSETQLPTYYTKSVEDGQIIWRNKKHKMVCLSALPDVVLENWRSMIAVLIEAMLYDTTVILVDDFLDPKINDWLCDDGYHWLIKISGERIWVSPLFCRWPDQTVTQQWQQLQRQLWENQPVRHMVTALFPEQFHQLPFQLSPPMTMAHWKLIRSILNRQIMYRPPLFKPADDKASWLEKWQKKRQESSNLALFCLNSGRLSFHPINDYFDNQYPFSDQVHQPIALCACRSICEHDGGSRCVKQEQTLAKLRRLVSPVTGVISHLSIHHISLDKAVKLYHTHFFTTPVVGANKTIANEPFVKTCLGKGISPHQSMISGLCEAIEKYSAHYRGDEPRLMARASTLAQRYVSYQLLAPYSERQYQQFANPNHPDSQRSQAAKRYDDSEIPWIPTWSLTQQTQVLVPFSCCFSHIPFTAEQFGRWHSNGCAAGNTLEEAILQALFELIERDATAIWWYNRVRAQDYDINRIGTDNLAKLAQVLDQSHHYWVLDITTDIGVPAMVAIGQDRLTGGYIMGFGCHLLPAIAALRALTELCKVILTPIKNGASFDFADIVKSEYLYPHEPCCSLHDGNTRTEEFRLTSTISDPNDLTQVIVAIVERLQTLGLETLVLNYSRAHLPIKTTKVFVPGLAHIWPQLANERLYSVPVKMGWQSQQLTEDQLNGHQLYL